MMLWALAVIVPGGLVLLALWAGVRAIKARYFASEAPHELPPAPAELLPKALPPPPPVSDVAAERVAA